VSGLAAATAVPRHARFKLLAVLLSGVAGTLVALALMSLTSAPSTPAPQRPFGIVVPAGWSEIPSANAIAAIRSNDRKATLTVRRTAPVRATGVQLVHGIGRELRARFPGFKPVNARFANVRGGRAFVYTFVHGHTVQVLALVSAHGQAYAIDGVAASDAPDAARQLAAVVRSFGP